MASELDNKEAQLYLYERRLREQGLDMETEEEEGEEDDDEEEEGKESERVKSQFRQSELQFSKKSRNMLR